MVLETVNRPWTVRDGIPGRMEAVFICAGSVIRSLPLMVRRTPATPLRVMCIAALDAVHKLQSSRRMTAECVRNLSAALDFAAEMNAINDGKPFDREHSEENLAVLSSAGLQEIAQRYQQQLVELENRRPSVRCDADNFRKVCCYREEVVDLSIRLLVAIINQTQCAPVMTADTRDPDDCLLVLCRIATLCQIIDDVLDYSRDRVNGLPSFLTATASMHSAILLTQQHIRVLSNPTSLPDTAASFPFRLALQAVSTIASVMITAMIWYHAIRVS